jgi:hypothetical protein
MQNTQAAQQAPATAARPNGAELRDQIKQSILAAQDAAREAALDQAAQNAPRGTRTIRIAGGQGAPGTPSSPQIVYISIAFFVMCAVMVIGWPLARAFGKRLERRADVPAVNAGTAQQLNRIEQAVEAMAIEVERISESLRFIAKLQHTPSPSRELKSS